MASVSSQGFNITTKDVEGAKVVEVIGAIDADTYIRFDQAVFAVVDGDARRVVLVLEKVPMINSMGISVIIRAYRRLKESGGALVLSNPSAHVRQVLFIQALEKKLPITGNVSEALKLLEEEISRTAPPVP